MSPLNGFDDVFTGLIHIEHVKDVQEFISKFEDCTGCTWRVGKTSVAHVFERSVKFECLHRSPTHLGQYEVKIDVGSRYLVGNSSNKTFICISVNEDNETCWIIDETNHEMQLSNVIRSDVHRVGDSKLSFGCSATLTFYKVIAGMAKFEIHWTHNHDLTSYASLSRRDSSAVVKGWFLNEFKKGVPAMQALRKYVHQLFEGETECSEIVVDIMSDR